MRSDATLVASELVSNAVMHSGCLAGDSIQFDATVEQGTLRIAVSDPGASADSPRVRTAPPGCQIGGLGLRLVQRLARRWGVEGHRDRLVWAELTL